MMLKKSKMSMKNAGLLRESGKKVMTSMLYPDDDVTSPAVKWER